MNVTINGYTVAGRMPTFTLDNRDKVRSGAKTQTRRVMKPQPKDAVAKIAGYFWLCEDGFSTGVKVKCPYGKPGDIRVMPEPLMAYLETFDDHDSVERICYADDFTLVNTGKNWQWKRDTLSSMFMPTWAGRTIVRYTRIWVERLQDISLADAIAEGARDWDEVNTGIEDYRYTWNSIYTDPKPVRVKGVITHYESYPWEAIRETREYRGKPWLVIGNPLVWAIEWELLR